MKNTQQESHDDDLRPEYELGSMQLRRVGPGRTASTGPIVRLDSDVVEMFPDSQAVNEALRFLIRIAKSKQTALG